MANAENSTECLVLVGQRKRRGLQGRTQFRMTVHMDNVRSVPVSVRMMGGFHHSGCE